MVLVVHKQLEMVGKPVEPKRTSYSSVRLDANWFSLTLFFNSNTDRFRWLEQVLGDRHLLALLIKEREKGAYL